MLGSHTGSLTESVKHHKKKQKKNKKKKVNVFTNQMSQRTTKPTITCATSEDSDQLRIRAVW